MSAIERRDPSLSFMNFVFDFPHSLLFFGLFFRPVFVCIKLYICYSFPTSDVITDDRVLRLRNWFVCANENLNMNSALNLILNKTRSGGIYWMLKDLGTGARFSKKTKVCMIKIAVFHQNTGLGIFPLWKLSSAIFKPFCVPKYYVFHTPHISAMISDRCTPIESICLRFRHGLLSVLSH